MKQDNEHRPAYLRLYENMYRHSPAWQAALDRAAGKAPKGAS